MVRIQRPGPGWKPLCYSENTPLRWKLTSLSCLVVTDNASESSGYKILKYRNRRRWMMLMMMLTTMPIRATMMTIETATTVVRITTTAPTKHSNVRNEWQGQRQSFFHILFRWFYSHFALLVKTECIIATVLDSGDIRVCAGGWCHMCEGVCTSLEWHRNVGEHKTLFHSGLAQTVYT